MPDSLPPLPPDGQVAPAARQPYPDPIPGIIPFGTLTLFSGAPGVGKTTMLAEWCRRWRDGLTICGKPTNRPRSFAFLAADRQWQSHAQWFEAVGFDDIPHYSVADDQDLDLVELQRTDKAYKSFLYCFNKLNPQPGCHLMVDPVSPLFIAGDPNRSRDVAVSLLRLSRLCRERHVNITCSAHMGKQKADPNELYLRPQDRIAGSHAFAGFSDTQMYLVDPNPEEPAYILGWVPRHSSPEEFRFARDKKSGLFVPYDLYRDMDMEEAVLALVPYDDLGITTAQLLAKAEKELKLPTRTAARMVSSLMKSGRLIKVARGIYKRAKPS
jgi:hypothetical protein